MKRFSVVLVALLFVFLNELSFAQTFFIARTGLRSNERPTYRLVEVFQQRGKWIGPDVGYIDFSDAKDYRENFFGGGAVLHNSTRLTIIEEVYLNAVTGSEAGALYFFLWTYIGLKLTPKLSGEVVYFPYLPLNKSGVIQHIVERAKLEYGFGVFKFGAGYGAYQVEGAPWQDRPFITGTLKAGKLGDFELWIQRFKDGKQLQVRYFKKL